MKKTYKEITIMNMLLCFFVVTIHLTSAPITQLIPKSLPHILIFVLNKSLCFCVPAFIFLSGFKLYNKYKNEKIKLKKFYGGRFKKIVVPYLVAVAVYFIYFFIKGWVNVTEIPQYIFLGTLAAHFYYIIIAVQCYLLFPLLKVIFKKFPKITLAASLFCSVVFNQFVVFTYADRFFGTYIFYFILGFAFAKYNTKKYFTPALIGMFFTGAAHLYFSYMQLTDGYFYEFSGLTNMAYITCAIPVIFALCTKPKNGFIYNFSKVIGKVSYNVYLYHILLIFILQYDIFPRFALSVKEQFLISAIIVNAVIILYGYLSSVLKNA